MKEKILIVSSDKNACMIIKGELGKEKKYEIFIKADEERAIEAASAMRPAIMLLDIDFLKLSGCDVLKTLRADPKTSDITVIFMSSMHTTVYDIVSGLKCGADDYIVKPFQAEVLAAKIKAHLRRWHWRRRSVPDCMPEKERIKSSDGKIMVDTGSRTVEVASGLNGEGKEHAPDLTKKEFDILLYFLKNRNTVISRHLLIRDLWSWPARISDKTVDKHVEKLRNKLRGAGKKIEAVFGIGYRFNDN